MYSLLTRSVRWTRRRNRNRSSCFESAATVIEGRIREPLQQSCLVRIHGDHVVQIVNPNRLIEIANVVASIAANGADEPGAGPPRAEQRFPRCAELGRSLGLGPWSRKPEVVASRRAVVLDGRCGLDPVSRRRGVGARRQAYQEDQR